MQPTQKPKSVGPHKSRSKTTMYKKSCIKNKKFRSASTQLRRGSTELNRNGTNLLQQNQFYKNIDPKNYTFINVGISTTMVTWKVTKNAHTSSAIDPFIVVHHIMKAIRGPSTMMNHQVYQQMI